jgi:lambda family phage portal protein
MREMARAWKAGQSTSLLPGWANYSRPIDVDLRYNLPLLRSRAREQSQNNDHVKHFISLLVANVIGPQGITLQAKPRLKSGQPDVRGADAVEAAWLDWQRRGTCDATGTMSWRDVCRIVMACMVRDGEALLRKLPGYGPGGFAVQLIDPETLDLRYNEDRKTTVVRLGVELDAWRKP